MKYTIISINHESDTEFTTYFWKRNQKEVFCVNHGDVCAAAIKQSLNINNEYFWGSKLPEYIKREQKEKTK